jgi:hypothetical protein
LLRHEVENRPVVSAATGGQVPRRVRALLSPRPSRRPWLAVALVVLLACSVVATLAVERTGDAHFDRVATTQDRI